MKETLKNILYYLLVIGFVLAIIYFLIMPIVEGGENLDTSIKERIEDLDVQTDYNRS